MINETIGKLGFGLMRLPKNGDNIDVEQTKQMVDLFMDAGFNYFDTAWAYEGSEEAIRKALVERYPRDSFYIASKHARECIKCGKCEEVCTQHLNIRDYLQEAVDLFGSGAKDEA